MSAGVGRLACFEAQARPFDAVSCAMSKRSTNIIKIKPKLSHSKRRGKRRTRNSKKTGTDG